MIACACHRDVEQAIALLLFGIAAQADDGVEDGVAFALAGGWVDPLHTESVLVVIHDDWCVIGYALMQAGEKDNRELESLGCVHGHEAYGIARVGWMGLGIGGVLLNL